MTIAACYVSDEGVVLGADSTTTYTFMPSGDRRHFNNAQKLFEVGEMGSSLGIVTWGLGGLPGRVSYRQMIAELADDLEKNPPVSVKDVADRWVSRVWGEYSGAMAAHLAPLMAAFQALNSKPSRTPDEEKQRIRLYLDLFLGFCIGGHVAKNRYPEAFGVIFAPDATAPRAPIPIARNKPLFWGVPNFMQRLMIGIDDPLLARIKSSPHWHGSDADLKSLVDQGALMMPAPVPLRDAIDWIYSTIFITIKALKFSVEAPVCGGPIEVAVISADRRFRWVRHKGLDQALSDHSARGKY